MNRFRPVFFCMSAVLALTLSLAPAGWAADAPQKLNINTATEAELAALPELGAEKARAIVEFREEVGDIKSLDELLEVKSITPEVLEKLKPVLGVEAISGAECSC